MDSDDADYVDEARSSRAGKRRRRDRPQLGYRQTRDSFDDSSEFLNSNIGASSSMSSVATARYDEEELEFGRQYYSTNSTLRSDPLGPSVSISTIGESQRSSPTVESPISSPSLARILNPVNVDLPGRSSTHNVSVAEASGSFGVKAESPPRTQTRAETKPEPEPLAEYTCPICFFPPTNATITPCGHICCGACLFTAVKSTIQRGNIMRSEGNVPRCPVCRAEIIGWDGKGGGVIGLKPRTVFSL